MEKDFVYEIETDVSELNEYNVLKPYAYQNMFAKIAEQHLNKVNLNVDTTMKYNLAWVLMSISFEIVKPVEGCIRLFANTWYSQRKGPYFRREFIFKNEQGELMFRGSTYSILLDLESRTVYRKKQVPFEMFDPIEEFTIAASPSIKTDLSFETIEQRKVYNSFIDCLGHVNNTRYGEFAYDALSDAEKINFSKLTRLDIFFLSELRCHDTFLIERANQEDQLFIRGYNTIKDDVSFLVVFDF